MAALYPPLPEFKQAYVEDETAADIATQATNGGASTTEDVEMQDANAGKKNDKRDGWTKDLYQAVKRINKLPPDDYYGFLGLPKTCTSSDIKKRYRKLAKLAHPDKNKWPDAKKAFQRISQAYQTLKDPTERKRYDADNKGGYAAPPMDADNLYQEEFHDNAFGDDSESDGDNDETNDDNTTKNRIKPNDAHRKIYDSATPFIQNVLVNPPKTSADKTANAEQAKAFNDKIAEQNKKDGVDQSQCQINYLNFESTALLAAPYVERLREDPDDPKAKEWVEFHDSSLALVNRQNGYPKIWTLQDSLFPDRNTGGNRTGSGSGKKSAAPSGGNNPSFKQGAPPATPAGTGSEIWKPGYTLHGEKIIAYIPRERTVRKLVKGVRQPAETITFGYQFIVMNEQDETIALVSGQEVGRRATEGYLGLPEEEIQDARYSEKRYTLDDADSFDRLIDFASNPFKTRSSDEPRHPPGYGLVAFKDGTEDVLSRAGLRKLLGTRDADWEIQECDKKHGRIPAWQIKPLGWREPRQMEIEAPTRRAQRQRQLITADSEQSDSDGLFVRQGKSTARQRGTRKEAQRNSTLDPEGIRGRDSSKRPTRNGRRDISMASHARSIASNVSRSSKSEIVEMRNEMVELKGMIANLSLALSRVAEK